MRKVLLIAGVISMMVISAGCTNKTSSNTASFTPSSSYEIDQARTKEYFNTPDILTWKADEQVRSRTIAELKAGKQIQEISKPRNVTIPSDIYPPQLVKYFQLGDLQFAIVDVLSGLTLGGWDEKTTTSSGIWYIDKNDTIWKPFVTLNHSEGYGPHNNIFDFWNVNNQLGLLLIDSYGGGSGEGTAKVITSNELDKNWSIQQCFYFAQELYLLQKERGVSTAHETIPLWLNPKINTKYKNLAKKYTFNSSTGKFQITYKDTDKDEVIEIDNCQNISFP